MYAVKSGIKDTGRVIKIDGEPSLVNLKIEGHVCDNDHGNSQKTKIITICKKYGIKEENIRISLKDCSPKPTKPIKPRPSVYERTGRSGSYHGTNRWNPGYR